MLAEPLLVRVGRIFFLEMSGIRQNNLGQIHRGRRCQDLAAKAVFHQARNIADVVQMRVRQQQPLNARGRHGQRIPVAQPQFLRALKESAIHHQAFAAGFQQIL